MAPLPRGTVTLVFSDIEGSTRLLRELRERYGEAVKEHRRLLRDAYEAHGGLIVDTESDATLAVFRRAADALAGVAEAQRALLASGLGVRVRMGVHTGEPNLSGGRYFGLTVNRGARICATAHGGQVLISEATATIVASDEVEGVTLTDRGLHRLKDFDAVERLFQLNVDGLPVSFPPLATATDVSPPRTHSRRRPLLTGVAALAAVAALGVGVTVFRGDDAVALARVAPNSVGVIDPDRRAIVASIPVGNRPTSIAVGRDSVWVTNADDGTVSQIDARRRTIRRTVSVAGEPTSVAVSRDTVWVVGLHGRRGAQLTRFGTGGETIVPVGRIDTRLGIRTGVSPTIAASPTRVVIGVGRELVQIDAVSQSKRLFHPADEVAGMAILPDSIWLGDQGSDSLLRLDPRTYEVIARTKLPGTPRALAAGGGAVWVPVTTHTAVGRLRLVKVDAESGVVLSEIDLGGGSLGFTFTGAVAYGEGAVWVVTQREADLIRVDEETEEVERVPLGDRPEGIAVGAGYVWVTVY